MRHFVVGLLSGVIAIGAGALALRSTSPMVAQQAAGSPTKVAFVNARLILQATPGYTEAESVFTRELQGYRNEIQRLQASLDSAARDFEQSSVVLSPTARDAKRQELVKQQNDLEQRTRDLEQRASSRQRELLDPIEQRVNAVIDGLRASGNYAIIFDVSAGSGIVAADRALDLTQRVIDQLKESGS